MTTPTSTETTIRTTVLTILLALHAARSSPSGATYTWRSRRSSRVPGRQGNDSYYAKTEEERESS